MGGYIFRSAAIATNGVVSSIQPGGGCGDAGYLKRRSGQYRDQYAQARCGAKRDQRREKMSWADKQLKKHRIHKMIEESKDNPDPLTLSKMEVKKLLENSGVPEKNMQTFEQVFAEKAGDKTELLATNIANTKSFGIETPDIVIKVNPERADLVETKLIDGRQCLVIAVDDHVEVNGISVRTIPKRTILDE